MNALMQLLKPLMIPIHREGLAFIGLFAIAAFALGFLWEPLWFFGTLAVLACVWFFRNPDRTTPVRKGLVVSPADGLVQRITQAPPPAELGIDDKPRTRISIFMSVFNVHVNRTPVDGLIVKMAYRPGAFLNATLDKASSDNERQSIQLDTPNEKSIIMVQIAGLIARRILSDVEQGDEVKAGERIGLIRFGSRVDIYLPKGVVPLVCEGQTAIGGETVLADLGGPRGREGARRGEVR